MSKIDKLLARLTARPTDFRWEELLTLLGHYGFAVHCNGGSHHIFQHPGGFTFSMSKTHPSGILKRYQVKAALEALDRIGRGAS